MKTEVGSGARVLLVDDDELVLRALGRQLATAGFEVERFTDARAALDCLAQRAFDVVVSDIAMPEVSGTELLRAVRALDLDLPVVLVTGEPAIQSALDAIEHGAFKYLVKPVAGAELVATVDRGAKLGRLARMKREALSVLGNTTGEASDRAGLEASFERALEKLWVAFQPIVRGRDRKVIAYEALMRSDEPSLPHPGAMLDAAERLDALQRLSRTVRARAARHMAQADPETLLFVNLHPSDLLDDELSSRAAPLSQIAERAVLEITERTALDRISDLRERIASLRQMGFRIAVDDLGAGYAGLASFAQLEPEVVKLDMSLIRDVHASAVKRKLVRSLTELCKEMGLMVVAEGIEQREERDAIVELGCDCLQGYLLARPGPPFPQVSW